MTRARRCLAHVTRCLAHATRWLRAALMRVGRVRVRPGLMRLSVRLAPLPAPQNDKCTASPRGLPSVAWARGDGYPARRASESTAAATRALCNCAGGGRSRAMALAAPPAHGRDNADMVTRLRQGGALRTEAAARAMLVVDRKDFTSSTTPAHAHYQDRPLPIGEGATISAPHMHAAAIDSLAPRLVPGARVLDVGSGLGYLVACFGVLVHEAGAEGKLAGHVTGIEHMPRLAARSLSCLHASAAGRRLLHDGAVSIHAADGRLGWEQGAPYDAIHVGAAAPEPPPALLEQLAPGGMLVMPVGSSAPGATQRFSVYKRDPKLGVVVVRRGLPVRYVPLMSRASQAAQAADGDEASDGEDDIFW